MAGRQDNANTTHRHSETCGAMGRPSRIGARSLASRATARAGRIALDEASWLDDVHQESKRLQCLVGIRWGSEGIPQSATPGHPHSVVEPNGQIAPKTELQVNGTASDLGERERNGIKSGLRGEKIVYSRTFPRCLVYIILCPKRGTRIKARGAMQLRMLT